MEVEFLILSRYAEADVQNNTLNLMGAGLLSLQATDFPTVQSFIFAVVRLRFDAAEGGSSPRIQVVVRNDRDETIHEAMEGRIEIMPVVPPHRYKVLSVVVILGNVIYPEPGYYRVVLLIDGEPMKRTIFKVERIERPQSEVGHSGNVGAAVT